MLLENKVNLTSQLQYEILVLFDVKETWSSEEIVKATSEIREKWSKLPKSNTRKSNDDESAIRFQLKNLIEESSLKVVAKDTSNLKANIYGKGDNFNEAMTTLERLIASSIDLQVYDKSDAFLDDKLIDSMNLPDYEHCQSDDLILSIRAIETLVEAIK